MQLAVQRDSLNISIKLYSLGGLSQLYDTSGNVLSRNVHGVNIDLLLYNIMKILTFLLYPQVNVGYLVYCNFALLS